MGLIRRITVIRDGGERVTVYRAKKPRRRVSRLARPLERLERAVLEGHKEFVSVVLLRRDKSNAKRKNGFLRDGVENYSRASLKALRKLNKRLR